MADEMGALDVLVGQNVLRFRTAGGISQAQLAEMISQRAGYQISQQTVFKIEKGTRPLRYAEAVLIAGALGVPLDALAAPADPASAELGAILRATTRVRESLGALSLAVAQYLRAAAELMTLVSDKEPTNGPDWLDHVKQLSKELVRDELIDGIVAAGRAAKEAAGTGMRGSQPSDSDA